VDQCLCFSYYKHRESQKPGRNIDSELICSLRVKPAQRLTHESFTCQLLDLVSVSSTSMFEDGEELISNVVHIASTADNVYKVPRTSSLSYL